MKLMFFIKNVRFSAMYNSARTREMCTRVCANMRVHACVQKKRLTKKMMKEEGQG